MYVLITHLPIHKVQEGPKTRSYTTPKGLTTVANLEIRNVTQADGGTYSVKASSVLGEANANINLNFSSESFYQ